MKRLTTAVKWFAYGLIVALLFAPRSGRETRQQLIQSVSSFLSRGLNTASQTVDQAGGQAQQVSDQMTQPRQSVQESAQSSSTTFSGGPA